MTPADLVSMTASGIEFVVGIALTTYILLVYIGNLKNGLSLGPSDKVHLTKALVSGFLHLTMVAHVIYGFWPHFFDANDAFLWLTIIVLFLMYYTYWLTALLCVYYCTNITTSGHHIVVWLKRNLSSYLLHLLLVLGLGSFAINCPLYWICNTNSFRNSTDPYVAIQETFLQAVTYRTSVSILGCLLPFTIASISTTFSAWSLINHMRRMKQNNRGFTHSKFEAQINATRTMVLFILISVIYGLTQLVVYIAPPSVFYVISKLSSHVLMSYLISEAIIIIQSSSKLRKTLLGKIFGRKRRNSETET